MFLNKNNRTYTEGNLAAVISDCLANNAIAQQWLIKNFGAYVKSIVIRYLKNEEQQEEAMNDVFLKVFNNLNKYDANQVFKAWLRTITVNTSLDYYRKEKENYTKSVEDLQYNEQPVSLDESAMSKLSAQEILRVIQMLPPGYKMVFNLYAIDGFTHAEIASKLGIKEGTSKSNLQDARKKLQRLLVEHYPDRFMNVKHTVL